MANESLKTKVNGILDNVRYYWKEPPKGRNMNFKEIASYSFGGIGAYLIVAMSGPCLLAATNVFITGTIGIGLTDMYIMYVIAVLSGIPLTGLRATIIDNTRNKAGKYRPYLLRMGIPSALLFMGIVWFPYDKLKLLVGTEELFLGKSADYIAKCAVLMVFNILLQFFYYFFYDAYENLIHVLSSNSQERADVASIKSVVYSFGPTVYNIIIPLIAQFVFHTNQTDIRVYKLAFPIVGAIGSILVFVVYANTQEKIIQAKTHVIQIKFMDSLRAVAKNKYFWIISLAGWIGFLESAYANIMYWLCNYGGACSNGTYSIITTIYGNGSLWGMLLAPFCIRKWGKKAVLIVTNLFNILFILMMLPFVAQSPGADGNMKNFVIWAILACLYMNAIVGSFAHILNPSIQADIRDYQQYITGERIDGMFAAVLAIGNVITLITAGVLPAIQERFGMTEAVARKVTSDSSLMSRILPGTNGNIGQLLQEQLANGQDNFVNPSSALYDVTGVLIPLLKVLIIIAAVGATLNVIPFFFYDLTENKQKSIVRVLKVRAVFEDYGNGALKDKDLVEMIDLVNNAKEMAVAQPKEVDKNSYKSIADKAERKAAKKAYNEALEFNEEIEISKFVCEELNKFDTEFGKKQIEISRQIFDQGLEGIKNMNLSELKAQLSEAKAMPKENEEQKQERKYAIDLCKSKISACKFYNKYYGSQRDLVEPDFAVLEKYFDCEDELDVKIQELSTKMHEAKKEKNSAAVSELKAEIKKLTTERNEVRKLSKKEMDLHAEFNRAAKPFVDARKMLNQYENFNHFDEIVARYDQAKIAIAEDEKIKAEEAARKKAEEEAELQRRKDEKAAKKAAKRNK